MFEPEGASVRKDTDRDSARWVLGGVTQPRRPPPPPPRVAGITQGSQRRETP